MQAGAIRAGARPEERERAAKTAARAKPELRAATATQEQQERTPAPGTAEPQERAGRPGPAAAPAVAERARAAGVTVEFRLWPRVPHCWQFFPAVMPEAAESLQLTVTFVQEQLRGAASREVAR